MAKPPTRPDPAAARRPAAQGPKPRAKSAAPRKPRAPRGAGGKGTFQEGMATPAWGGGPSWLGVAIIVLAALVLLPIAAAVLGDIWAVVLGALIGGFALGRATAR